MTSLSVPLRQSLLAGPEAGQSVVSLMRDMRQHTWASDDESAMRDALQRIFTELPESLTVDSLYDALIAAGTYILAEGQVQYPLPVNGKFRATLDDDTIYENIAAIGMLIPMCDGAKGNEWSEEREDNWDLVVDATYQVLKELWQENTHHVWYGEELLHAIQERLLQKVTVLQLSYPSVALLKSAAQDNQHPYARLLTFILQVCREHADVNVFGKQKMPRPQSADNAKQSPALQQILRKLKGKSSK